MHRAHGLRSGFRLRCLSVVLVVTARGAHGAEILPAAPDFLVNSYTQGLQAYAAVGAAANGDFVVAWGSFGGHDGDDRGVFARRFDSAGAALATEVQVNTYTTSAQDLPAVAVAPSGAFVIVWTGYGNQDGEDNGIFARRFDAAGVAQATELQVNTYTTGLQLAADVAVDGDGDFVVTWTSFSSGQDGSISGVFAQRFDATGAALATEFQVNTYTPGSQESSFVSANSDGDFVIVWHSGGQDGDLRGAFGQRYDSAGVPQASEFQINTYTPGDQTPSAVALDAKNGFVVAWNSRHDGSEDGVFARRFDSDGAPQASELQVNTYATASQSEADVAFDAAGGFVMVWQSEDQDGSDFGVFVRGFDASGVPQSTELRVNAYTDMGQRGPAVAVDAGGRFVVVWHGYGEGDSDSAIFARRFLIAAPFDVDGNGVVQPLTDALLILRYTFGFRGGVLVSGAVDLVGCSRCDAPAIEAYIETQI